MPTDTLPVAVQVAYESWVWLDARVASFPAHARRALGDRLLGESIDLLDDLLVAAYAKRRSESQRAALERASGRVSLLRVLLRGARERRYLSMGLERLRSSRHAVRVHVLVLVDVHVHVYVHVYEDDHGHEGAPAKASRPLRGRSRPLSIGQHEHVTAKLVELGRMLGGWRRDAARTS